MNPTLTELLVMPRADLGRLYEETVGYDPFDDDPTINPDEVARTLREYLDEVEGSTAP